MDMVYTLGIFAKWIKLLYLILFLHLTTIRLYAEGLSTYALASVRALLFICKFRWGSWVYWSKIVDKCGGMPVSYLVCVRELGNKQSYIERAGSLVIVHNQ